ncbi:MAG: hypothetical protein JXX28_13990 [Deltaproteobacteria bacterium]|nr:hypothetical protein [Deltaproteobacteria bacterium]
MLSRLLVAGALLLPSLPAFALDAYMWGVGPQIGTIVIPGHYPIRFPKTVDRNDTLSEVRDDLSLGGEAVYYVDGHTRTLAMANMGFGRGYLDYHLILKYNYVTQTGAMDFLAGGGLGVGQARWRGDGDSVLKSPYYPARVEGSALIRDNTRAYQLTFYGQYNLPAQQRFWNADGVEVNDIGGGVYALFGTELTVLFGDFTPPKNMRKATGGA